jgi:hypothetical protein
MKLIPNAKSVATSATSMWAAYGAIVIYLLDKLVAYLQSPEGAKFTWTQAALGILLVAIPALRLLYQQSLATLTERSLLREKIARKRLEIEATSDGPPITPAQVKAIKQDAAAAAETGEQQ